LVGDDGGLECKTAISRNYESFGGSVVLQRHRCASRQAADSPTNTEGARTARASSTTSAGAARTAAGSQRERNQDHRDEKEFFRRDFMTIDCSFETLLQNAAAAS